jgi:ATP-binding cassette subfamily B protein IrtB
MFKQITKNSSILSIQRVIARSECSSNQFYQGLVYRCIERCLEIVPMVVCFLWLFSLQGEYSREFNSWLSSNIQPIGGLSAKVVFFTGVLLCLFVFQILFAFLGQRQSFLGSYRIMQGYRERLIDRTRQLPLGTLYQYRSGQLAEMLTQDIKRIESIFTHIAAELFSAWVAPLVWLILLFLVDKKLALSLIAGLPLAIIILVKAQQYFSNVSRQKQEYLGETAGVLTEFSFGIKTLKLFNRTQVWIVKLEERFRKIKQMSIGVEAWGAGPVVSYRLILELSVSLLFFTIASSVGTQQTSTIDLMLGVLFLMLAFKILTPLLEASEHLTVLRYAIQSESRLNSLFEATLLPEPSAPEVPIKFDIQFHNVNFAYEEEQILNNINFTAREGTVTAIVGASGTGKSTVVNLVARFYEASSGGITIGGIGLECIGTEQLYEKVSVVFQNVQLCDATILENVRAGKPSASDDEVVDVCKLANCDDFIRGLPDGYGTWVGEGGTRLSGGERQRVSIARGLLKDAPILLLDEVTASVDPENQLLLQQSLSKLAKGKTVLVIAHRLSTIRYADQILVMEQGEVCERGTHVSLLDLNGLYARLWHAQ